MFSNHDKTKVFLLSAEIAFGIVMLLVAAHLINLMALTSDWFGYTLPALILIIVGLASTAFGIDTLWLRVDVDGWERWDK